MEPMILMTDPKIMVVMVLTTDIINPDLVQSEDLKIEADLLNKLKPAMSFMSAILTAELAKTNSEIYSADSAKSNVFSSLKILPLRNVGDSDLWIMPTQTMLKELSRNWINKTMTEEN